MNTAALKDRLKAIATERGITFNQVWKQLLLERFLARLSNSDHQEKFIFKGGLLLAQYLVIGRETTDADFLLTNLKGEAARIESVLMDVVNRDMSDGFQYEWSTIEELRQPHMDYPGFRATFDVRLEKMRDKVQIDIGVGDSVKPVEDTFHPLQYKGKPMFAGEISLLVYPVETILAEKLETIISKGATNSRMKDYHDVILILREPGLIDRKKLKAAVKDTFQNRGTNFRIPIQFESTGISALQRLWTAHLGGLGRFRDQLQLPEQIAGALSEINQWLSSPDLELLGD